MASKGQIRKRDLGFSISSMIVLPSLCNFPRSYTHAVSVLPTRFVFRHRKVPGEQLTRPRWDNLPAATALASTWRYQLARIAILHSASTIKLTLSMYQGRGFATMSNGSLRGGALPWDEKFKRGALASGIPRDSMTRRRCR